ncbi:unnamed protein product [Parajaminaea phylloscopi]
MGVAGVCDARAARRSLNRSSPPPRLHGQIALVLLLANAAAAQTTAAPTASVIPSSTRSAVSPQNTVGEVGTGTEKSLGSHANIVDLSICLASLVGCLIIIIPYILNKRTRKLRHSLIVGLATSDLVSALTVIASTSYLIDGGNLVEARSFCTFLGLSLSVATYTQHFWNLCILGITYMILVHPLSNFTMTIERRVLWLWPIIWLVSLGLNGFAWGFATFSYAGGYCYVGDNAGKLFSYLFPLIPRILVVAVILVLYTRLFFFLRRTNLLKSPGTMSGSARDASRRPTIGIVNDTTSQSRNVTEEPARAGQPESFAAKFYLPLLRMSGATGSGRGSGSSYSQAPSPDTKARKLSSTSGPVMPIEMKDYAMVPSAGHSPRTIATAPSLSETPMSPKTSVPALRQGYPGHTGEPAARSHLTAEPASLGLGQPRRSRSLSELDLSPQVSRAEERGSADGASRMHEQHSVLDMSSQGRSIVGTTLRSDGSPLLRTESQKSKSEARPSSERELSDDADSIPDYNTWAGLGRMKPRTDTRDFNMVSAPREHLRHFTVRANSLGVGVGVRPSTAPGQQSIFEALRRHQNEGSESQGASPADSHSRRGSAGNTAPEVAIAMPTDTQQRRPTTAYETVMGDDWTWGMDVTAAAGTGQQNKRGRSGSVLMPVGERAASVPREHQDKGQQGQLGGNSMTSSFDEHGVENMGSTLNRQASALLLLYPFAYVLLFAVSLGRLIRDAATPHRQNANTNNTLNNVSRGLIFAQGLIDCIIFQLIERQFRRRMKRKRARARGEEVSQGSSARFWQWGKRRASRLLQGRSADAQDETEMRRRGEGISV